MEELKKEKVKELRRNGKNSFFIFIILSLFLLLLIIITIRSCMTDISKGIINVSANAIDKISEVFSTKENFIKILGPIILESPQRRLQFYQRDQVAFFRIVRYRGKDNSNHDYVEFYKKESDKRKIEDLQILLKQYCIWEAKGAYEFNFYLDLVNLNEWDYKWDGEKYSLTLFPPDIGANNPAEIEPLRFTKIADSVSIDEGYTKERLEMAITSGIDGQKPLKIQLAEDQKKFFYDEARKAIKELYIKFLSKIPNIKIDKYPEIIVIFPHERDKISSLKDRKL